MGIDLKQMEIKFLPHDFKYGRLPIKAGDKARVKRFMGMEDVPVIVTSAHGTFVMAKLDL